MEVKINREIRNYTEYIFFGLSLRQFIFSVLACVVAVVLYFTFSTFWVVVELTDTVAELEQAMNEQAL